MRRISALLLALLATPALAQFPPPGIYTCRSSTGATLGTLSLLVAGDYGWQPVGEPMTTGQIASSGSDVEALTGPLAEAHWRGTFFTEQGVTRYGFSTDTGDVACGDP